MEFPVASVIIPVYNDSVGLEITLESVLNRTDYSQYEIIIVDNDSTDDTPEVAQTYTAKYDHVTLVAEREIQSPYAARNTGISRADGEILVFLDADQRVLDGWLTNCIEYLQQTEVLYLAPDIELDAGDNPGIIARYNEISGFPIEAFINQHRYAPTSCLFVRRKLLEGVGEFDQRLVSGGDLEYGNRVDNAGYDLGYYPEVAVIHPTRSSIRALVSRNSRIGRGHCQLQRYYPDRYGRIGIPPRPSGIREQQYDGSLNRWLYNLIALSMTAARGIGYYRECLSVFQDRLSRSLSG